MLPKCHLDYSVRRRAVLETQLGVLAMSFYFDAGDAAYQAVNNPCVGEWDATSYSGSSPPCLRRTDGNKIYPHDLVGQVHSDGEIWSRALWDIRAVLSGSTTDQIVLEHHFSLPANATMPVAALEMIAADAALNAGVNEATLREKFCDRGILSPGYKADVILFDYAALRLHEPKLVRDLPAGGGRLMQSADGYRYTIVSGEITYEDGKATGALPGRLVRGATLPPTA